MNAAGGFCLALLLLLLGLGHAAQAVGKAVGAFGFRATVEGEQFAARFNTFEVIPRLDADRRPTGFVVEIGMAAIDSGNADRDAEMQLAEWFDTAAHPIATFRADAVEVGSQGGYVARGELRIKGIQRSVEVPFSWQSEPWRLGMSGELRLDRRWFGVGPEDDGSVAAQVTVFYALEWPGNED